MTNETIPNVQRKLLEELRDAANDGMNATTRQHQIDYFAGLIAQADALLSAPSPAGVDGLEVVGWYRMDDRKAITPYPSVCATWHKMGVKVGAAYSDSAKAIIDGLRGEVGAQRIKTCTALKERNDAREERDSFQRVGIRAMEERDHLAQCLKFARTTMAVVADNANLRGVEHRSLVTEVKRIDAALSAVCAAAPNIATTSEHSGS